MLNAKHRMDENKNVIVKDEDIESAFALWDGISRTQSLGIPPAVYNFYMDFFVPAYEKKRKTTKNEVTPHDDGITIDELMSFHYEVAGSVPNLHTLQKITLPVLETAGLISKTQSITDKRRAIFKPKISIDEEIED